MKSKIDMLKNIYDLVEGLTAEQLEKVVEDIYAKITDDTATHDSFTNVGNEKITTVCKKCGSTHVVKNGTDKRGNRRYLCRDCKATFGDTVGSVIYNSHKEAKVWKRYISIMLNGGSITKCASECDISTQTAFIWRHKILNALSRKSFSNYYDGLVEMDEMYIRISYKGNHKKSKNFVMPRESFKRGSDNRIASSSSKASVLCIVQRNKGFYGTVACRGMLNFTLLSYLFSEKVSDESIIMTDGLKAYGQYFKTTNAEHIALPSQQGKPTIKGKGVYHINNVNALQQRFRRFLRPFNGVSTKYLNNYLGLFLWLENNKTGNKRDLIYNELNQNNTYMTASQLAMVPPTPDFAPAA